MHSNSPNPPNGAVQSHNDSQINTESVSIPKLELEEDAPVKRAIRNEKNSKTSLEDPLTQSRLQRLLELDNLADITLPGYTIKLIRLNGPTSFREISEEVAKCYSVLRRSDGTKYHGDFIKALKGCLSSSGVFIEQQANVWGINEAQAQLYESRTTEKIKTVLQRQVSKNLKDPVLEDLNRRPEQAEKHENNENGNKNGGSLKIVGKLPNSKDWKNKRSASDIDKMFTLFQSTCKFFKNDAKAESAFQEPFKNLKGEETPEQLSQKLGKERLIGALQCFDYFSPIIEDYMRLKAASSDYKAVWKFLEEENSKDEEVDKTSEKNPDSADIVNKNEI